MDRRNAREDRANHDATGLPPLNGEARQQRFRNLACAAVLLAGLLVGCGPERPPAPDKEAVEASAAASASVQVVINLAADSFTLTYAGARGKFEDSKDAGAVPGPARGLVRVNLLDGRRPPAGMSYVVNLDGPSVDGVHPLETIPVHMFEELALGRGLSSEVVLPGTLAPPPARAPAEDVVVYKTEWCGVCKQLIAYLERKGIAYVARDIEKDVGAAAELKAKAGQAGVQTGSVPVIDVRGTVMVGFDRDRLERLLRL